MRGGINACRKLCGGRGGAFAPRSRPWHGCWLCALCVVRCAVCGVRCALCVVRVGGWLWQGSAAVRAGSGSAHHALLLGALADLGWVFHPSRPGNPPRRTKRRKIKLSKPRPRKRKTKRQRRSRRRAARTEVAVAVAVACRRVVAMTRTSRLGGGLGGYQHRAHCPRASRVRGY